MPRCPGQHLVLVKEQLNIALEIVMADTTDIEKKSLEAHVELCAERYRFLENQLKTVEQKVEDLVDRVSEIRDLMSRMNNKRYDQIVAWAGTIIVTLLGVVSWLFVTYVFNK